jgi:hypothetical protein
MSIHLDGRKLSHLNYKKLYAYLWAGKTMNYWAIKHDIDIDKAIEIDWDACGKAIKTLFFAKKRRTIKHATGFFGTGSKMLQWKFQDHDKCPLCDQRETAKHILKCTDNRAKKIWNESLEKLREWMEKNKTHPHITACVITRLREWHDDKKLSPLHWKSEAKKADKAQTNIGWHPMAIGQIANT